MEYKSTILIVDDNLAGRETLKGLLFGRGYNLTFASSGIEALAKAEELTPDLMLLDVMMPGMDGFEVCQRLRQSPKVAEIPVIMVTALDDRDSRLRGIEAGADDFVSKPFDHAELRKRVQTITRLNRYRRLLSERTRFEWVVDHADDGYVIITSDDTVHYANSQARLYLNLPAKSENPGESFLKIAKQQYNTEPSTAWANWPKKPKAAFPRYLVRPASPNTNPFWLSVDIIEMGLGAEDEYLIRLRDITPKVTEKRSMWSFHGQVSHKLRTPLNHLSTSLEMIDVESLEGIDDDSATFLSIAKRGAIRLKDEVDDIFQYIEASNLGKAGVSGTPLSVLPNVIKEMKPLLELENVNLSSDIPQTLENYHIILSKRAIELTLWELFENSKKFHPKQNPNLEVVISQSTNGRIVLKIIDDGVTLSPDQLDKMWAPYYQAEKYFTGQVLGTGLGLSIVTSLIWSVGGTCISYNRSSQPGIVVELQIPGQDHPY